MAVARLGAGMRAVVIGKTKSGKTHLTQTALGQVSSWVVIDSKRSKKPNEPQAWAASLGVPVSADPGAILRHRRLVYQVSERSLRDRQGWNQPGSWGWLWTQALRNLKRRGHTLVDWNEGLQTLPSNGCHPEAREIFTQGEGFDLASLVETQAANWLDTIMLRQAEVFISFRCEVQLDRDIIARARGVDAQVLAELDPWWWAYHDIADRAFTVFPPLPPPRRRRVPVADAAPTGEIDDVREDGGNAHEQPEERADTLAP